MRSPFFDRLRSTVAEYDGLFNAHLHLDRAYTLDPGHLGGASGGIERNSHISLQKKHGLISGLHASDAYKVESLRTRMSQAIDDLIHAGTAVADSVIDVTDDDVGMTALETANELARENADRIAFRTGSYNPFGFPTNRPERWKLLEEGAKIADFIGALPERDIRSAYPDHIGYEESCVRVLDLARRTGKFVHVHTDQRNQPSENATEALVDIVRREGAPQSDDGAPMIWAVHAISPTTYDEKRFRRLVDGLLECSIGVICCPTAALGMRQLRPVMTPTSNSIARVLDFVARGVHVRLGSDNVADMCSPSTTADLLDEVMVLSAALRFYDIEVLARLAAGQALNQDERDRVRFHLERDAEEINKILDAPAAIS